MHDMNLEKYRSKIQTAYKASPFTKGIFPEPEDAVKRFESRYAPIPAEYRWLLLNFGGCYLAEPWIFTLKELEEAYPTFQDAFGDYMSECEHGPVFPIGGLGDGSTLHQSARIERTEDGFQTWIYNRTDYNALLAGLEKQGLSLPTVDEWAYLCGGGCRTLFPWGDGLVYSMRLHWFEDMDEDENRPYDMEEPNFFGLSIAYDPYMREVVQADRLTTCGGDGGRSICGGLGIFLGFLPCSPHCKPEVQENDELNGDYDFYRPIIRVDVN